jgi:DNA polymerase III subunit epsilon
MGFFTTIKQLFNPTTQIPDNYKNYLKLNATRPVLDQSVDTIRFVILDTETTGLKVNEDKLLSIGAIEVIDNQIIIESAIELYIQHESIEDNSTATIHGILKNAKVDRKSIDESILQLLEFCGNSVIVGHHIGFDIAMINKYLATNYGFKMKNLILDTANLYIKAEQIEYNYGYYPLKQDLGLDNLLNKYRIEPIDRHTAYGDAYTTSLLFLKLLSVLKKRGNLKLKDLFPI